MAETSNVKTFIEECVTETKKVTWPDQDQLKNATFVVIIFTILVSAVIWAMDLVSKWVLVDFIMGLFGA